MIHPSEFSRKIDLFIMATSRKLISENREAWDNFIFPSGIVIGFKNSNALEKSILEKRNS